eukprot:8722079-Pyramimonas_sp.AAC.1
MAVLPPSGSDPALVCAMRGVVHGRFLQTPAMSEHAGVALCGQVANRPAQLGVDCRSAIKPAQKELPQQLSARSKIAGIRKFARALEGTALIQGARHVKAHRTQACD